MQKLRFALVITAAVAASATLADAQARGSTPGPDRNQPEVRSSRDGDRYPGGVHSSRDGRSDGAYGRGDDRYGGVYSSRDGYGRSPIPRGMMPPRGMCRIWLEGVPAGRQPRVTDCSTALRHRPVNGRVIFGTEGIHRSSDRYGRSQQTIYRVMLDGRRCEVREYFDRSGRAYYERRCEQGRRSSRDDRWGYDDRRDDRIRFGDWHRI